MRNPQSARARTEGGIDLLTLPTHDHSKRGAGTLGEVAPINMRPLRLALFTLLLTVSSAAAERVGGGGKGGGGGGRLGRVSAGISSATNSGSSSSSGSSSYTGVPVDQEVRGCYGRDGRFYERDDLHYPRDCRATVMYSGTIVRHRTPVAPTTLVSRLDFYAGAQKVYDSDGSASIELGVTEGRFRIGGTYTRYFERKDGGGVLTMSMPTLSGGIRIDDMGATAVYLEGGVVHARTNGDVMADSKITGPMAGMRVEHTLSKNISVLGDVQQMWFPDEIRATAGRIGVRYRYVQASVRVLDFNVGPALYGPEVGVRF